MILLELKQCWRDGGVQLVLIALCFALVVGVLQGHAQVTRTTQALAASVEHQREFLHDARKTTAALDAAQLDKDNVASDPRDVASFASTQVVSYARLALAPLAGVSIGQSELFPSYVALNTGTRDKTMGSTEVANPESLQTGPLDVAFVLVYLLPLAIIAIGYGVRAGEREAGIDVLIRSVARHAWSVYARRLALRVALLYGVVVLVMLGAAGIGIYSAASWYDLGVVLTLAGVYTLFWYGVVLAIALLAPTSAVSALRLISIWVVLVVLVPAAANVTARLIAPVPSRAEFVQAVRDATDAIETQRASLLEKYLFDHPEMTGANTTENVVPSAIATLVTRRAVEARAAAVESRYQTQLDRQEAVIARFEWLSPGIWLQNALNRLAGTDTARYRAFLLQVTAYHEQLRDFFEVLLRQPNADDLSTGSVNGDRPHFYYPVFTATTARAATLGSISSLLALMAIGITVAGLMVWTRRKIQ